MARGELRGTRRSGLHRRGEGLTGMVSLWLRRAMVFVVLLFVLASAGVWVILSDGNNAVHTRVMGKFEGWTAALGYRIDDIYLEGRENTPKNEVMDLVGLKRGDALLRVDPELIRADLKTLGWVKDARVERRLPGTLFIRLEERVPLALWKKDDKSLVLIDSEGVEITRQDLARFKHLIMVRGDGAPSEVAALVRMLAAEPDIERRVDHAVRIENRRWDLVLKGGKVVKLPEADIGLALRQLAAHQEREGILDKPLASLDVRDPARLTVRTEIGKALEYIAADVPGGQNL